MTARMLVQYDGSAYFGWARQPDRRTVEGELLTAMKVAGRRDYKMRVAGRTDRGVHALGQVVSYEGDPVDARSLNSLLPGDAAVLISERAPDEFDARHHASSRTYRYLVRHSRQRRVFDDGRAWWWRHRLDTALLDQAAALIVGEHDFTAFTVPDGEYKSNTRHVMQARWIERGDGLLEFWIQADSFLRRMVRVLVATQLDVANGARDLAWLDELLDGASRAAAGQTAPAHGLYLASVEYDLPIEGQLSFGELA